MKYKKKVTSILFILAILGIGYMVYRHLPLDPPTLQPLIHPSIKWKEGGRLVFLEEGFAIIDEYAHFYDNAGQTAPIPYEFNKIESGNYNITDLTSGYVLLDSKAIYKVEGKNLIHLYDFNHPIVKMSEYHGYLLLIEENSNGKLVPKFLDTDNLLLLDFGLDENFYCLDMDSSPDDASLSILTLDVSASFPSSKVLHYDDNLALVGVITSIDQFFFNVFRYPQHIVLIGNQGLVCYNMENEIIWSVASRNTSNFQVVENELGLLVYLDQFVKQDDTAAVYNAVLIRDDGSKQDMIIPMQLTSICFFKDKFAAIQYGKKIVVFDQNGKVEWESPIAANATKVSWNPYKDTKLLVVLQDGTLQIYTLKQEE